MEDQFRVSNESTQQGLGPPALSLVVAPLVREITNNKVVSFEEAKAFYWRFCEDPNNQFFHPAKPGQENGWTFLISYDPDEEYVRPQPFVGRSGRECWLTVTENPRIETLHEAGRPANDQGSYPVEPPTREKLPLWRHDAANRSR